MTVPHGPSEDGLRALLSEVDCRIEHGAESGGHLEYVRDRLRAQLPPVSAPDTRTEGE